MEPPIRPPVVGQFESDAPRVARKLEDVKKGTFPIILGVLGFASTIRAMGHATPTASAFGFAFATVALLWGLTDKLDARFPSQ